jgi:hypothetical protein
VAGKLKALMEKMPNMRTAEEYEGVMDDFVEFAGGHRLGNLFEIPKGNGRRNADYYFDCGDFDCIMELKQVRAYDEQKTIESFWRRMEREQRFMVPPGTPVGTQFTVDRTNMSSRNWSYFYDKIRPNVVEMLKDADRQLRITDSWLPRQHPARLKAAFILNSGDFNLPIDMLGQIIRKKVNKEWQLGRFRNLDYTMCGSFDMHRLGENQLRAHHHVRESRPEIYTLARYMFDKWIRYTAEELGMSVEVTPADDPSAASTSDSPYIEMMAPYRGKLRLRSS